MRRTFISPEFKYVSVYGTLNMEEESSFFGSKMLEIEDLITIGNESILFYQNEKGEQIDFEKEYDAPPIIYNSNADKQKLHTLVLDEFQTQIEKNNYTKWKLTISIRSLLKNYLFATLKKYRTFEGVSNEMTYNRNVDFSINEYIQRNVINRYKFTGVDLYLVPVDLLTIGSLKYQNIWDREISQDQYKFTKFSTVTDFKFEDIQIFFAQNFSASQYAFRYYFNLKFEKL
jgi:hypothetical protein